MQEKFWLESEARHLSLVSWWRGFAIGMAMTFGAMVGIGLFL